MTPSMFSQKTSHKHVVLRDAIAELHKWLYVDLGEDPINKYYKVGDGQYWRDVCQEKKTIGKEKMIVKEAKSYQKLLDQAIANLEKALLQVTDGYADDKGGKHLAKVDAIDDVCPAAELLVTKDCKRLTAETFLPAMKIFFPEDYDYRFDVSDTRHHLHENLDNNEYERSMKVGFYKYEILSNEVHDSMNTFPYARSGLDTIDSLFKWTQSVDLKVDKFYTQEW